MAYPYVMSTERLRALLKKISEIGVPDKVTQKWLKGVGYTSTNDRRMLGVLEFVGLVGADRVPTELWRKEMRARRDVALGKAVKLGYAELYAQYPDADQRDDEALRTFFAAHTELGAAAVGKVIATYRALCRDAQFDKPSAMAAPTDPEPKVAAAPKKPVESVSVGSAAGPMTVNINVQLQVPPDATGEIYDKFFEAMRKHLWPPKK